MNQLVTARESALKHRAALPFVVGRFLPARQVTETLLEKHTEEEHHAVQHWLAMSTWGRRLLRVGVLWKPQSEQWVDKGIGKTCVPRASEQRNISFDGATVQTDLRVRERKVTVVQTKV